MAGFGSREVLSIVVRSASTSSTTRRSSAAPGSEPGPKGGRRWLPQPYTSKMDRDFREVRAAVLGKEEHRQLADMRRSGAVEADAGGTTDADLSNKMATRSTRRPSCARPTTSSTWYLCVASTRHGSAAGKPSRLRANELDVTFMATGNIPSPRSQPESPQGSPQSRRDARGRDQSLFRKPNFANVVVAAAWCPFCRP
jgi:hypothetical protein